MELEEHSVRISEFRSQLSKLLSTDTLTIHNILMKKPSRFNVKGVYLISTPDDNEIVYVGKTRTKSVIGRLSDHRTKDTKSDLKMLKLKLFSDYPQDVI
jgi:ribosomal protein S3